MKTTGKKVESGKGDTLKERKQSEQSFLLYIILIGLAVLVIPYLARGIVGNPSMIGEQSYLHARMAEYAISGTTKDDLIGGREFSYNLYHYFLGIFGKAFGITQASKIIPVTLGLIALFLCYLLLRQLGISPLTRLVIMLALILSPGFIYTFTVSNPHALAIVLMLLGFLLFLREEPYFRGMGIAVLLLAGSFYLLNTILIAILVIGYSLRTKTRKNEVFIIIIGLTSLYVLHPTSFIERYETVTSNIVQDMISDLGGKIGFGIFYAIIAIIGIVMSWENKKSYITPYCLIIGLISFYSVIGSASIIYLNFLLAYFVGLGLIRLQHVHWEFQVIKNLTFLIIICGLLFSSISYINRLSTLAPDKEMVASLQWLSEHSLGDEVIVTSPSYGYLVEQVAGRPVVLDSFFSSIPQVDQKLLDMQDLFYSMNLEEARDILATYHGDYILITTEMKEGEIWTEPDQGLLYLLRNNETFKNAYMTENAEIWKVIR